MRSRQVRGHRSRCPTPWNDPQVPWQTNVYRCFDDLHRKPAPCAHEAGAFNAAFEPGNLDGAQLRWRVARIRRRRP